MSFGHQCLFWSGIVIVFQPSVCVCCVSVCTTQSLLQLSCNSAPRPDTYVTWPLQVNPSRWRPTQHTMDRRLFWHKSRENSVGTDIAVLNGNKRFENLTLAPQASCMWGIRWMGPDRTLMRCSPHCLFHCQILPQHAMNKTNPNHFQIVSPCLTTRHLR